MFTSQDFFWLSCCYFSLLGRLSQRLPLCFPSIRAAVLVCLVSLTAVNKFPSVERNVSSIVSHIYLSCNFHDTREDATYDARKISLDSRCKMKHSHREKVFHSRSVFEVLPSITSRCVHRLLAKHEMIHNELLTG